MEKDYAGRINSYAGVEEGLPVLLDLFKQYGVKSTFFVTGDVLKKYEKEILEVKRKGHEIGYHSFNHLNLINRDDVRKSTEVMPNKRREEVFGIKGFRAPYCAVNQRIINLLEVWKYAYDSSVVGGSFYPGRYNCLFAPKQPYHPSVDKFKREGGMDVLEIPISVIPRFRLPLALSYLKKNYSFFKSFLKYDQELVVFYAHAHEFVKDIRAPGRFGSNERSLALMEDLICSVFSGRKPIKLEAVL